MDAYFVINVIVLSCVNTLFLLLGSFLNAVVILCFWKSDKLRKKVCHFMILVLSCVDLAVVIVIHPLIISSTIAWYVENEALQDKLENLEYVTSILYALSFYALLTMNIERYVAIRYPIYHMTTVTKTKLMLVFSALLLPVLILKVLSATGLTHGQLPSSLTFLVLLIIMFLTNCKMYIIAKRRSTDTRNSNTGNKMQNENQKLQQKKNTNLPEKSSNLSTSSNLSQKSRNLSEKSSNLSTSSNLSEKSSNLSTSSNLSEKGSKIFEKCGNLAEESDNVFDKNGNLTEESSKLSEKSSNLSGKNSNLSEEHDNLAEESDNLSNKSRNLTEKSNKLSLNCPISSSTHEKSNSLSDKSNISEKKSSNLSEKSDKLRKKSNSLQDNQHKRQNKRAKLSLQNISICILAVTCFTLCALPGMIFNGLNVFMGRGWFSEDNFQLILLWVRTLITMNSTFNSLLFFWKNAILRKEGKQVFAKVRKDENHVVCEKPNKT